MIKNVISIILFTILSLQFNYIIGQVDSRYLADYIGEGQSKPSSTYSVKSTACSNTVEGTIGLVDCSDIGSAAFSTAGILDAFDSEGVSDANQPSPPCGPAGNALDNGSWHQYDLASGVEQVMVDYSGGFLGDGGFSEMWMSFYQGADCSSLTNIGCGQVIDKSGPSLILLDVAVSGVDDTQPLWVYTWGNKGFDIDFTLTGVGSAPAYDDCASPSSSSSGCNLGATGATFTTPSTALGAGACNGGTWYSNENTVFYTFTATDIVGSIDIDNLTCNDGVIGEAQVGVWTDCASVGTYGAGYIGCAVGTGVVALGGLNIGDTYVIAIDGQAGDACTWDIVTTGVALPVELIQLDVEQLSSGNNVLWSTASELNADYFEIQRSDDGVSFRTIGYTAASGNSQSLEEYEFLDTERIMGRIYYRLKQVDLDGKFVYQGPIVVDKRNLEDQIVYPNPTSDVLFINVPRTMNHVSITITDVTGRVVKEQQIDVANSLIMLDVNSFNQGVYFIQIPGLNDECNGFKFVKE